MVGMLFTAEFHAMRGRTEQLMVGHQIAHQPGVINVGRGHWDIRNRPGRYPRRGQGGSVPDARQITRRIEIAP